MIEWLIGISIVLQLLCVVLSGFLALKAVNGSWRFWIALTGVFAGIVIHHSAWLLESVPALNVHVAMGISIGATYLISFGSLAAMAEAVLFHRTQRCQMKALSSNILELERRLEERERGRRAT